VDFEFITRQGYGKNVLQREAAALNTIDGARKAIVSRSDANGVTTVQNTVKASVWSLNKSNMGISVSPGQPWTAGQAVTVTVTYPYSISIMCVVVGSGTLTSTTTQRIE